MANFIKEAFGELEHVVWPTPKETNKYMQYTVSVIIVMAVILAILGYVYRDALGALRTVVPHAPAPISTDNTPATVGDLQDTLNQLGLSGATDFSGSATDASGNAIDGLSVETLPTTDGSASLDVSPNLSVTDVSATPTPAQ